MLWGTQIKKDKNIRRTDESQAAGRSSYQF